MEESKSNEINFDYCVGVAFCLFGIFGLLFVITELIGREKLEENSENYQAKIIEKHELLKKNNRGGYVKEYSGIVEFIRFESPTTATLSISPSMYRNFPVGSVIPVVIIDGETEISKTQLSTFAKILIILIPIFFLFVGLNIIFGSKSKWHLAFTKYL